MGEFETDLKRGKQGETAIAATLAARGNILTDVSGEYEYQRKDIDFIVSNGDKQTTLEVKTDYKSEITGNLFIETYNTANESRNGNGWYTYCQAQYMAFVQLNKRQAHIIAFDEMKSLIDGNKYRVANTYNTSGYLLPIGEIKKMPSYQYIELLN